MTQSVPHSDPAKVTINGVEIVQDTFGEATSAPLLLIAGWGGQMISWDDEFCAELAARGHWVIRFDHRDVGLSTKLDEAGVPDIPALQEAVARGEAVQVPYTLRDMAHDVVGLLDASRGHRNFKTKNVPAFVGEASPAQWERWSLEAQFIRAVVHSPNQHEVGGKAKVILAQPMVTTKFSTDFRELACSEHLPQGVYTLPQSAEAQRS